VGSSRITLFSQKKPRQMRSVSLGRKPPNSQDQSSPSVSAWPAWEMPTIMPASLSPGHGTVLLGPPSVPSKVAEPSARQSAARRVPSERWDQPATQPWLLMAMPRLWVPPSDGSRSTV
jgi:hypothetical protein